MELETLALQLRAEPHAPGALQVAKSRLVPPAGQPPLRAQTPYSLIFSESCTEILKRFHPIPRRGKIVELPTADSVNTFAEWFFAGFTRVTGTQTNAEDRSELEKGDGDRKPSEDDIVSTLSRRKCAESVSWDEGMVGLQY